MDDDIFITVDPVTGVITVATILDGHRVSERYIGYTVAEAVANFRQGLTESRRKV